MNQNPLFRSTYRFLTTRDRQGLAKIIVNLPLVLTGADDGRLKLLSESGLRDFAADLPLRSPANTFVRRLIRSLEDEEQLLEDPLGWHPLGALCRGILQLADTPVADKLMIASLIIRYQLASSADGRKLEAEFGPTDITTPWRELRQRSTLDEELQDILFSSPPSLGRTNLVGRASEKRWLIRHLVGEGRAPAASVRGVGGIGKTELAAHVAHDSAIQEHFEGRILWVRCGAQSTTAIQSVIATELLLPLEEQDPFIRSRLINKRLSQVRRSLIILDDIRQEHKAEIELLQPPPPHALLVTSRLANVLDDSGDLLLQELNDEQALELLADTLEDQVNPSANPQAAQQIVLLLEGMPLAIILAGRWLRKRMGGRVPPIDPLQVLLDALRRQMDNVMDQDEHRQDLSVRITFNISYDDLSMDDQKRVRRLGIFALNRFMLSGLQQVWQLKRGMTLRAAQRLENAGLVRLESDGVWWMHNVLRQYAIEYLLENKEEASEAGTEHAAYVMVILGAVREPQKLEDWLAMAAFRPEITKAGEWLDKQWKEQPDLAATLVVTMSNILHFDVSDQTVGWLQKGIEAAKRANMQWAEVQITLRLALMLSQRRQYDEAELLLNDGLAQSLAMADGYNSAPLMQHLLANNLREQGHFDEASLLYRKALDFARDITTSGHLIASMLPALAHLLVLTDQIDEAMQLFRQSMDYFVEQGDSQNAGVTMLAIANLLMYSGQIEQAERAYRSCLAVFEDLGDIRSVALTQTCLADLLMDRGELDEAEQLYRRCLEVFLLINDSLFVYSTQSSLATLQYMLGEYEEAEQLLLAGLEIGMPFLDPELVATTHARLGELSARKHEMQKARTWFIRAREGFAALGLEERVAEMEQFLGQLNEQGEEITLDVATIQAAVAGDSSAGQQVWEICSLLISSGDPSSAAVGRALQQILLRTPPETAVKDLDPELREQVLSLFQDEDDRTDDHDDP